MALHYESLAHNKKDLKIQRRKSSAVPELVQRSQFFIDPVELQLICTIKQAGKADLTFGEVSNSIGVGTSIFY